MSEDKEKKVIKYNKYQQGDVVMYQVDDETFDKYAKKGNDHTLYWYFNFKDGNQVIIPLDKENSKFQELHKK